MVRMDEAVWKSDVLAKLYLTGVRGAIPLAAEQIAVMTRLVEGAGRPLRRVLDLGSGGEGVGRHPGEWQLSSECSPKVENPPFHISRLFWTTMGQLLALSQCSVTTTCRKMRVLCEYI